MSDAEWYPYGQMAALLTKRTPRNDDQTRYRVGKLCELVDEAIVRRGSVDWSAVARATEACARFAKRQHERSKTYAAGRATPATPGRPPT